MRLSYEEFQKLSQYANQNFGIYLGEEKQNLVFSRLSKILRDLDMEDFTQYYNYLIKDKTGDAKTNFINKITTNHTYFMREIEHFKFLTKNVLPYIEEKYMDQKDVRLWCAGCSSGEEAYSLQFILNDYFQNKPDWNTKILATDISTDVLKKAYEGVYSNENISQLSEDWKLRYFEKYDNNNKIVQENIRQKIIFRKLNLLDSFAFKSKMQVIFCRNVMIYFDKQTKENLLEKFYNITEEGGYLFIGHSEFLNQLKCNYKYIVPSIYRKVR